MKKFRSVAAALLFLFAFLGCDKGSPGIHTPTATASCFNCSARVELKGISFTCRTEKRHLDEISFKITSPAELEGLCIVSASDRCTLSYKGMNFPVPAGKLPDASFADMTAAVYGQLSRNSSVKAELEDKYRICKGKCIYGEFIAVQNGDTGFVERIEIPGAEFKAEFYDFEPVNVQT